MRPTTVQEWPKVIVGRQCCATIVWVHISARMNKDATMTCDYVSAITTYVMWREGGLWNVSVLQSVHFYSIVLRYTYIVATSIILIFYICYVLSFPRIAKFILICICHSYHLLHVSKISLMYSILVWTPAHSADINKTEVWRIICT
jgi:hypothetical protein